jgi:hypothetical protein
MDINMMEPRFKLYCLFCQNLDGLEVVAMNLRCLLGVKFDGRKEATPLYNFSRRH